MMAQKFLGIEIGSNGISVLLLESGISGDRIEGHKRVPFNDEHRDDADITAAIKAALDGLAVAGARCSASIPARYVFFRNLRLPAFKPRKIRPILPFELEPLLPFPAEELIADFSVLGDSQNPDQTDIVTATIRKADLSRYLGIFKAAGVEPETITFQGYPLSLCLAQLTDAPEDWMLVNMDATEATLFIFRSGQLAFVRCASISSGKRSFEEDLSRVIRQTICAVESVFPFDFHPEIIWIDSNEENRDPYRFQALENRLGIRVAAADLSKGLKSKKKPDVKLPGGLSGTNSGLSLALLKSERIRGIHFLQGPFSSKTHLTEYKSAFLQAGLLLGTAFILAGVYLFMDLRFTEVKVSRLNAHIVQAYQTTFPEEKVIVDPAGQMKIKVEALKKRSLPTQRKGPRIRRVDLLNEISTRIPVQMDVEVLRLIAGEEDLVISGNTDTFNSVNDMKSRLEGSRSFREIVITSANLNRSGDRVDFVMTIRF